MAEQNNNFLIKPRVFHLCNCKRSKCVKKYCECYILGKKCNENCKCTNCKNRDELGPKQRPTGKRDK